MTETELLSLLSRVEAAIKFVSASNTQSALNTIITDHFASGGGRLRAQLALQAAASLGLSPDTAVAIASGCELLHNASLIHDDLQDRDAMRRGAPAIWARHGENAAICAGDLLLSAAYAAFAQAGSLASEFIAHSHRRVAEVISGQYDDLTVGGSCSDMSEYERIAAGKSGPLLALPIELALLAAGRHDLIDVASRAATSFAIAYQMHDDLADASRDAAKGALNAVTVAALRGDPDPRATVRRLAVSHLTTFEKLATQFPSGLSRSLMGRSQPIQQSLHVEAQVA